MYYSSQRGDGLTNTKNAIRQHKPFKSSGALSAQSYADTYGELPSEHYNTLRSVDPDYVIYSYSTPIAWHSEEHGWTIPDVKYSRTTTRHQSVVRGALNNY